MSVQDFVFSLRLSDEARVDDMVVELTTNILQHSGYSAGDVDAIVADVRQALAQGAAAGLHRCELLFSAAGGELQIVVCYVGAREHRTVRRLP